MVVFIFCRVLIALVLLAGVIVSFSLGVIGINDMCGSNWDMCPWNPSQKLIASFAVAGALCVTTLIFSILGCILGSSSSSVCDSDDTISYDNDIWCIHGATFIIITAVLGLIVILTTIIYYAMPRSFDRATLLFFLVVTHFIGGFSISWAFVPMCSCNNCCDNIRTRLEERRRTKIATIETRRLEAQNEAARLRLALQQQESAQPVSFSGYISSPWGK